MATITPRTIRLKRKNELREIAESLGLEPTGLRETLNTPETAYGTSSNTPTLRSSRKPSAGNIPKHTSDAENEGEKASDEESETSDVEEVPAAPIYRNLPSSGESDIVETNVERVVAITTTQFTRFQRINEFIIRFRRDFSNARTYVQCIIFLELCVFLSRAIEWNLKIATVPLPTFSSKGTRNTFDFDLCGPDIFVIMEWHHFWLAQFAIFYATTGHFDWAEDIRDFITDGVVYAGAEACVHKRDEDWGLIYSICDEVNAYENGAKEAAKFIRKKIGKFQMPNLQYRVLTIFKSLAENCGAKFHAEIASKKFLDEIEFVVTSPLTEIFIKQKIIEILKDLNTMFLNEPSLWLISNLYNKLTVGDNPPVQRLTNNRTSNDQQKVFINNPNNPESQIILESSDNPTPINTIVEDIELSKNIIQLFTQTISFTDPESEDITKNELIQEFYSKCKALNQNIVNYISETQDEQWLNTLLSVNQEFVSSFKLYEDMVERGQVKIAKQNSKNTIIRNNYNSVDSESFAAGVGGSGTSPSSSLDPFSDLNEVRDQYKSAKSRG
ncbi:8452_t:CDS:10 [Diversispora eburnea]|uniref:8452_t:CDS:1 n=1 Tax=Diversispora eburnea TaxID=1213867 RepID=A0A9N8ZX11_9GLOM|nr:8452_t:CDS:10 [Diversispora eburnea]